MKHLNLILFIVCTQLFSQTPTTKTLGGFSELKVYDLINVELIKASENKIIISGANSNNINIKQKNSTLKIRMKLKYKFNGAETQVKIYYTDIDIIDANEGSFVFSKDTIKQYEIVLKAQEGSQISVKTETKKLILKSLTTEDRSVIGPKSFKKRIKFYPGEVLVELRRVLAGKLGARVSFGGLFGPLLGAMLRQIRAPKLAQA